MKAINHFYFLGAGASFGARSKTLPLGDTLAKYVHEWLLANTYDRFEPIQAHINSFSHRTEFPPRWLYEEPHYSKALDLLKHCERMGYERAISDWLNHDESVLRQANELMNASKDPRKVAQILRAYEAIRVQSAVKRTNNALACSMLNGEGCVFGPRHDLYDTFFHQIDLQASAVITINYDILPEEALERVTGRDPFVYPADKYQKESILPFFKLHGSCNWIPVFPNNSSATLAVAEELARRNPIGTSGPHESFETNIEDTQNNRTNSIMKLKDRERHVLLATYGPEKPVFDNYLYIERTHQKCLQALRQNPDASATLVGVRLTSRRDDSRLVEVVDEVLRLNGRKQYVNPSENDSRVAREQGFEVVNLPFDLYLDAQCERLS